MIEVIKAAEENILSEAKKIKEEVLPLIEMLNADVSEKTLNDEQKEALEFTVTYAKDSLENLSRINVTLCHARVFAEKFNYLTK